MLYFSRGIVSDDINTINRSFFALHEMKPAVLISHYPNLINHSIEKIRSQTLHLVRKQPIFSFYEPLKSQLTLEQNTENINIINETIEWIDNVRDVSETQMKELVRSVKVNDRIKAAAWLCHHEKEGTSYLLDVLLKDKSPKVAEATCFYISSINNPDFLKSILIDVSKNKSYEHRIFKTLLLSTNKAKQLLNICFDEFTSEKKFVLLEKAFRESLHSHKDIIFPLFDNISVLEKVKNLSQHFPQAVMSSEERLKNIIFYVYAMLNNVTKAFAIEALNSRAKTIPNEIIAQIYGNDLLLKEIGYSVMIYNRDEYLFNEFVERENEKTKLHIIKTLTISNENKTMFSRLEVVQLLKNLPLFSDLPFWKLSLISSFFDPYLLKANEPINTKDMYKTEVHIFINGIVESKPQTGNDIMLKKGDIFGFYNESIFKRELNIVEDSLMLSIVNLIFI